MVEASRDAVADDVARIVELAHMVRDELRVMKGGEMWFAREAWPEPLDDTYAALLARDDATVVVGTIDDTVIGYGVVVTEVLRSGARLGVITDLFVEPEARSVGVGECMALRLIEACVAQECIAIDALALPGHRATKNFFERNGFTARALTMHRSLG
ncbi:MAG: GNAT family N-acetyltransferase [Acidimicrobiia bacterium]